MSRLIGQMELTLDGFMTGPQGEMDWFSVDPDAWQLRVDKFAGIGTVLMGRRNYEGFAGFWPAVAARPDASATDRTFSRWLDSIPKVVFSRHLQAAPWHHSRLASGTFGEEVGRLKAQGDKDLLIMSSATLIQEAAALGLLDELWLTVHPVALGEGRPLFRQRMTLEVLESRVFASGQLFVRYGCVTDGKRA